VISRIAATVSNCRAYGANHFEAFSPPAHAGGAKCRRFAALKCMRLRFLNLFWTSSVSFMKKALVIVWLVLLAFGTSSSQDLNVKWIHGSEPCSSNMDVPFQVHAYNDDTFILRENKCINYEGPFIYLLFGQDKVFMQDTGAAPAANAGIAFPVRETVQKIVDDWSRKHGKTRMQLVVTHSHAHGDHTGGDPQFSGQPDTTLVGKKLEDVQSYFGITDWPNQQVTLDLGGRVLDIIPIPGHEATSIAVYDRKSRILLTGDTVYPGRLYISNWPAFKSSIERLAGFVKAHDVVQVLGTHIEMSNKPGIDYPVRTTYQPEEHDLAMTPANILELYDAVSKMKDTPVRDIHSDFIIYPR
jgi:glyoxylase-like metal-dependent hydrolase (beta-lactamase superfamily II)